MVFQIQSLKFYSLNFAALVPFLTYLSKNNAMNKSYLKLIILLFCLQLTSCSDDDNLPTNYLEVVIDAEAYNLGQTDNYTINSVRINGDFLTIRFSASGCSGENWNVKLIDAEGVAFSQPPQRYLFLSLENLELCQAVITKELNFDISALQIGGKSVLLNIKNFDEKILYEY